jgi:hypothetical protein
MMMNMLLQVTCIYILINLHFIYVNGVKHSVLKQNSLVIDFFKNKTINTGLDERLLNKSINFYSKEVENNKKIMENIKINYKKKYILEYLNNPKIDIYSKLNLIEEEDIIKKDKNVHYMEKLLRDWEHDLI